MQLIMQLLVANALLMLAAIVVVLLFWKVLRVARRVRANRLDALRCAVDESLGPLFRELEEINGKIPRRRGGRAAAAQRRR